MYLGLEVRVNPNLRLSFYADHFQFDWLTFNTDVPSQGHEYLVRLTYFKKRKLEAYAQYRFEEKAISTIGSDPILHATNQRQRNYARFHLNHKIRPFLEFRNRIEFSWSRTTVSEIHTGFLLYQDILFKPLDFPLSFTTRMAYFDMDDYAARIYAFENDLLYNFSIPAYFGEGFRYYLNLRYRVSRSTTLEGRWDQTVFAQTETISSGWEEIQGNKKSNIKLQLRIQF